MTNNKEELLDIVDVHDRPIDVLPRSRVYEQNLKTFRVINAFIVNKKGQLWVPRRAPDKRLCPSLLDVSVGGHVSSGETYEQAFARELNEEVNLHIEDINYELIGYFSPFKQTNLTAFMKVYKIHYEETPKYNPCDFTESFWLTPEQLLQKMALGDRGKSDLEILIRLLFS